jgi:hypothetical protein
VNQWPGRTHWSSAVESSLYKKIGIRQGMRAFFIDAPASVFEAIGLPSDQIARSLAGPFDYIHLFTKSQKNLDAEFPRLKLHLLETGMLWVSWPKGGQAGTDLNLKKIIQLGYSHGLVESKTISIDSTWSAIKFTFPKEGKQYNNSYGQLK